MFTWNFQLLSLSPECRYVITFLTSGAISNSRPFLTTAGVNSKFSAALTSSLQICTDVIFSKEKQMKCIWRITCLEEDILVVFPTGFDKRHDSESDKIVFPLSCYFESSGGYTEAISKTHAGELNQFLFWGFFVFVFFFKESTWRPTRENCFFFLSSVSAAGRKFSPTLLITFDKIKDLEFCRFSVSR